VKIFLYVYPIVAILLMIFLSSVAAYLKSIEQTDDNLDALSRFAVALSWPLLAILAIFMGIDWLMGLPGKAIAKWLR
jgi:hypothetical protein